MKKFKLLSLAALFLMSGMLFVGCDEEEDGPITSDKPVPSAPSNMRATSASSNSVLLRWDASISEDSTWFAGYELTITGGDAMLPKAVSKTQPYQVNGLQEGVVYTFTLKAKNTDNKVSSGSSSVQWSPASRFETADIKMYVFESSNGSGLSLFDATNKKPMSLKAAEKAKWHLGFDSRNNKLVIGPASVIQIGTATPSAIVEMSYDYWEIDGFEYMFLPETTSPNISDLSKLVYTTEALDLKTLNATKNVVFTVRVKEAGATSWNYAKVMVVNSQTGFLQGTGNDAYIQLKVSYQIVANVPFAK